LLEDSIAALHRQLEDLVRKRPVQDLLTAAITLLAIALGEDFEAGFSTWTSL